MVYDLFTSKSVIGFIDNFLTIGENGERRKSRMVLRRGRNERGSHT
jgi:hypothetical protein